MAFDRRFILGAAIGFTVGFLFYSLILQRSTSRSSLLESRLLKHHEEFAALEIRESVAVLIAGQCHRFIYRENPGPLFTFSSQTTMTNKQKAVVDVYIVLQCGHKQSPFKDNSFDSPPYMETFNITDIEQWYRSKGANTVTVKLLDDETLDEMFDEITNQTSTLHASKGGYDLATMLSWHWRWGMEARKFYSRHFAFSLAQQAAREYTGYVFWREDNYFFEPLDLDEVLFSKNKSEDVPFIVVDAPCEFGSYSDKMYVANHDGAALLFSSTYAEFVERMKRFVLFGYYRMAVDNQYGHMQPEAFVHDSLSTADVERHDMNRVDVRYKDGLRCIPKLYFGCMPQEIWDLASQHNILVCEDINKAKMAADAANTNQ